MTTTSFDFRYSLYGLRLASNRPRPDDPHTAPAANKISDRDSDATPDMTIDFVGEARQLTAQADLDWSILRERVGSDATVQTLVATTPQGLAHRIIVFNEPDYLAVTALPNAQGQPSHVEVRWHNSTQTADEHWYNMASWVFDVALSYMMRLQIPANLHGGAVAMGGKAVVFVGEKSMGKSTLTAALIGAGHPMLTDDHVALWPREDGFWVEPGAPRLRLWPASLPVLGESDREAEDLPSVYTFLDKRIKHLRPSHSNVGSNADPTADPTAPAEHQATALPLGTIYLLQPRDPARDVPEIVPLPAMAALHELWARRYSTVSVSSEQAAAELAALAQVVQQTRICYLYRPDGLDTLPQVIAAMRADMAAVEHAPVST